MNPIRKLVANFSAEARSRRAELFRRYFEIDRSTRILDLGSEDGSNISQVLRTTEHDPQNIYIADIDPRAVESGKNQYGFTPIVINESGKLPYKDKHFDIVYCSSVIEHVTIPKPTLWKVTSEKAFREASLERQREFAFEINRIAKQFFVQTPSKGFPIESHTWLPFVGYLPRQLLLPILSFSNRVWLKKSEPDFNLLSVGQMADLFPDSKILIERKFGFTKSIMAIKTDKSVA